MESKLAESTQSRTLAGQWALVTGAAKRVGAAVARKLHGAGANGAIHYFPSTAAAEPLAAALNAERQGSAVALGADLKQLAQLRALVAKLVAHSGRLDILVN